MRRTYYYKAKVVIDPEDLAPYELRPGMPVDVMIRHNDRTLLDYLLAPLEQSFSRAFKDE